MAKVTVMEKRLDPKVKASPVMPKIKNKPAKKPVPMQKAKRDYGKKGIGGLTPPPPSKLPIKPVPKTPPKMTTNR